MVAMRPTQLDAYQLLHEGILAFSKAEAQGMYVDVEYCKRKQHHLTRKIEMLEEEFQKTNFFKHWEHVYGDKTKLSSDHQLAHILYDIKKIEPAKKTRGGRGSTDIEALQQLNLPEINLRIEAEKLKKLRDTYLDSFLREQVDGIMHPFFNLHTARTFRSSCDHPNFQNIPKRDEESMNICRRAIRPRPGHQLAEADYSGLEVHIGVCYHMDPNMMRYITDPMTDMHRDMGQELFLLKKLDRSIPEHKVLRDATKNGFVFPEFYGSYYANCAYNLACTWGKLTRGRWKHGQGISMPDGTLSDHFIKQGIDNFDDYVEHIRKVEDRFWNERFQVYQAWKDAWWKKYQNRGYFDTLTGFRCSGVMGYNDAINYPVQGSAFHCLLWAFIVLTKIMIEEKWDTRLIGQIHDAIVLDIEPSECEHVLRTVKRVTCKALPKAWPWIIVPLDVEIDLCEIDQPWNTKEHYELPEVA